MLEKFTSGISFNFLGFSLAVQGLLGVPLFVEIFVPPIQRIRRSENQKKNLSFEDVQMFRINLSSVFLNPSCIVK